MATISVQPDEDGRVKYTQRITDPNFDDVPNEDDNVLFAVDDVYLHSFTRNGTPQTLTDQTRRPDWLLQYSYDDVFFQDDGDARAKLHLLIDFDHPFDEMEPPNADDVDIYDVRIKAKVTADGELIREKECSYNLTVQKVAP